MSKQVVITGAGLVSSFGQDLKTVVKELALGKIHRGVTEAYQPGTSKITAPLPKIDFHSLLGQRGLKYHSINTLMLTQACMLAFHDANLVPDRLASNLNLIAGSAMGNHEPSTRYLRLISQGGPDNVMPMDGVDTASNSSIDFAAIRLNTRGNVKMVSTGSCSSTDAIIEAAQHIKWGKAHIVVASGFEKLYPEMLTSIAQKGCLGPDNAPEHRLGRPYDMESQGLIPGEGAATLILEHKESALSRNTPIRGHILGYACRFNPSTNGHSIERGLVKTILSAIENAGCDVTEIDWVCGSAGGMPIQDRLELMALRRVFGQSKPGPVVSSIKGAWGDAFGAATALAVVVVLGCIETSTIPPMPGLEKLWPEADGLDLVTGPALTRKLTKVLIISQDTFGFCSCLIIGKS